MKLSNENFEKAQQFIHNNARALDVCLFEYEFAGGTAVSVLNALTAYQNEDGGFGNAIEPDFRLPDSSPMATKVSIQLYLELFEEFLMKFEKIISDLLVHILKMKKPVNLSQEKFEKRLLDQTQEAFKFKRMWQKEIHLI